MLLGRVVCILAITFSTIFGAEVFDMPEIKNRIKPEVSSNTVFSFYESIKDSKEAVVNISTQKRIKSSHGNLEGMNPLFQNNPLFKEFFGDMFGNIVPRDRVERSLGSGVIISKDGYIITNNHVIDGADVIIVNLPNSSKEYKAELIGKDPKSDLAVIKIDAKNLNIIRFANSNELKVGDIVFAIGNPFGVGESVTQGIISALNKSGIGINDYENFIQTDASINPGNSGGALVDTRGGLVGINTAILSKTGGNHGIGFAIPSNMVKKIATALIDTGKIERGFMGVTIQDLTEEHKEFYEREQGAMITAIATDSPASKAGLNIWDLIVSVDGEAIKGASDLKNKIGSYAPKSKIKVGYIRDKKLHTTTVFLDTLQSEAGTFGSTEYGVDGLSLKNLNDILIDRYRLSRNDVGVLVVGVERGSSADEFGFLEGDLIIQIENYTIKDVADFKNALKSLGEKAKRVLIKRRGVNFVVVIR